MTKSFACFAQLSVLSACIVASASAQLPPRISFEELKSRVTSGIPRGEKNEIIVGQLLVQLDNSVAESLDSEAAGSSRAAQVAVPAALAEYRFRSRIASTGWTLWEIPTVLDSEKLA